jgi:Zn-dependent protease with chaperone function
VTRTDWRVGAADPARVASAATLIVLTGALVIAVLTWTPWHPLPDVPGGSWSADPAADFTAAELAREDAYHRAVRPPLYAALAVSLTVAAALGFTTRGAGIVAWAGRLVGGGWVRQVLFGAAAVSLVGWLATVPFAVWAEAVRRRYGLSSRDWWGFAGDAGKGLAVGLLVTLVVLLGFYALVRAAPRIWWAAGAVLGASLVLLVVFVYPLTVEPLFNRFTPMPDGPLRASLVQLARADGVPVRDVLVADASIRTTTLNAYVSGLGATKRIVVYDTALRRLSPAELRAIVAHELGHVKAHDVRHGALVGALGAAATVCLLHLLTGSQRLLRRAGVERLADPRSLALVLALVALVTTLAGPLGLLTSRRAEARADVHALNLTRAPQAFIEMQRQLAVRNLSDLDPHPLVYGLFASHPTAPERIALARRWAAAQGR